MGDVRFIGMCWDKCRFLEALSEAGQRWQKNTKSEEGQGERRRETRKDTLCKSRGDHI